jgi:hypothetical protein
MDVVVAPEQVARFAQGARYGRPGWPFLMGGAIWCWPWRTGGHDIRVVTVYRTSKVAKYWRAR